MSQRVRPIDFRRPSKFPRELVRRLEHAHAAFCRSAAGRLSAELRAVVELSVAGTEQLPWVAAVEEATADAIVAVLELSPHGTQIALTLEPGLSACVIDRMLGGDSSARADTPDGLTDIELAILRRAIVSLVEPLSSTWLDLGDVRLEVGDIERSPVSVQLASPSEPTLVLHVAIKVDTFESQLELMLPYRSVERVVRRLDRSRESAVIDTASAQAVERALRDVEVELRAEVGAIDMPLADVRGLRPGDLIRLRRRTVDGVLLLAGDVAAHVGVPGRNGAFRAVQVRRRA